MIRGHVELDKKPSESRPRNVFIRTDGVTTTVLLMLGGNAEVTTALYPRDGGSLTLRNGVVHIVALFMSDDPGLALNQVTSLFSGV